MTEYFTYKDGGLWVANGVLVACEKPDKDLVIPEGVISIVEGAFKGKNISSVSFPSTLKRIGSNAFDDNDIHKVFFNYGLEVIGDYSFCNNMNLSSVTFPETLKVIGANAFGFTSIDTVQLPKSMIYISDSAFRPTPFYEKLKNIYNNAMGDTI